VKSHVEGGEVVIDTAALLDSIARIHS
jgi:hypothetical protein